MKLYPNISADMTYQDCGSSLQIFFRGPQQECELLTNAAFNFGASKKGFFTWALWGDCVSFFSTKDSIWLFFANVIENRLMNAGCRSGKSTRKEAENQATSLFGEFLANHRERNV